MGFRGFFGETFADRAEAGRRLAARLEDYAREPDLVVLALPRGGVPVAYEVARALGAPLYALVVRKLGAPGNPELAIGAIASDGTRVVDQEIVSELSIPEAYVEAEIARQEAEVERRVAAYGAGARVPDLEGRTVLLVDDGVATGSTARAALRALRSRSPRELVLAVPVGARDVLADLGAVADRVVAVRSPEHLFGVGVWYEDFRQSSDEEVVAVLGASRGGE